MNSLCLRRAPTKSSRPSGPIKIIVAKSATGQPVTRFVLFFRTKPVVAHGLVFLDPQTSRLVAQIEYQVHSERSLKVQGLDVKREWRELGLSEALFTEILEEN